MVDLVTDMEYEMFVMGWKKALETGHIDLELEVCKGIMEKEGIPVKTLIGELVVYEGVKEVEEYIKRYISK